MFGDGAAPCREHHPRRGGNQVARFAAHQVCPQGKDGALGRGQAETRARLAAPHGRLDRAVKILNVGRRVLVEDDEIDRQTLHPPVFVGPQKLTHLRHVHGAVDAQEHDWQVARDRERPKPGLRPRAARDRGARRAPARVDIEDRGRQALEIRRLLRADTQVAQLDLALRPGQRAGALEGGPVAMLVDQVDQRFARGGHDCPEGNARDLAWLDPEPLAQREDRIENGARRV